VQRCATAFVDALARRRRKVFVPRTVAVVYWLRTMVNSRLAERVIERQARTSVPAMEEQVRSLRRGFGTHTAPALPAPAPASSAALAEQATPGFIADRYHR
jgi:hypothetical protein